MNRIIIFLSVIISTVLWADDLDFDKKISKAYDYSKINDSLLFKYDLTDIHGKPVDRSNVIYNTDEPLLVCIATPYSCSHVNKGMYKFLNDCTEIDSMRTCFIFENHYLKDTIRKFRKIEEYFSKGTRCFFDTEGRNAELLKFDDTGNNYWIVILKNQKIIHVAGFSEYVTDFNLVEELQKKIDELWMEEK